MNWPPHPKSQNNTEPCFVRGKAIFNESNGFNRCFKNTLKRFTLHDSLREKLKTRYFSVWPVTMGIEPGGVSDLRWQESFLHTLGRPAPAILATQDVPFYSPHVAFQGIRIFLLWLLCVAFHCVTWTSFRRPSMCHKRQHSKPCFSLTHTLSVTHSANKHNRHFMHEVTHQRNHPSIFSARNNCTKTWRWFFDPKRFWELDRLAPD